MLSREKHGQCDSLETPPTTAQFIIASEQQKPDREGGCHCVKQPRTLPHGRVSDPALRNSRLLDVQRDDRNPQVSASASRTAPEVWSNFDSASSCFSCKCDTDRWSRWNS